VKHLQSDLVSPKVFLVGKYHRLLFIVEDIIFFSFLKGRNVKLTIRKQTSYDAQEGLQQILLPNNLHQYIAYSKTKQKPINCQLLLFLEKKRQTWRDFHITYRKHQCF